MRRILCLLLLAPAPAGGAKTIAEFRLESDPRATGNGRDRGVAYR